MLKKSLTLYISIRCKLYISLNFSVKSKLCAAIKTAMLYYLMHDRRLFICLFKIKIIKNKQFGGFYECKKLFKMEKCELGRKY